MEVIYYISFNYQKRSLDLTDVFELTISFQLSNYRYGFATPPNYNDHELYCGGFTRQWRDNSGKCGICGDPWNTKQVICNITRKHKINFAIHITIRPLIQLIYLHILNLIGVSLFCDAVEFEVSSLSRIKTNKKNVMKQTYA